MTVSNQTATAPILFVHGLAQTRRRWDEVIAHLPGDRRAVTYDLRGHGTAPAGPLVESIDDFVDDLVALLDGLPDLVHHVVGFSLGGLIAQRLAVREPHRMASLTVIGAVAGRTDAEVAAVRRRLQAVEEDEPAEVARRSIDRWFTADYVATHPMVEEQVVAEVGALDPECYRAAHRVLAGTDLVDELHLITAPTLAITGQGDVGSPPHMAETIAAKTGGRAVIVPNVNHLVVWQHAPRVAQEILEHITRVEHRPAPPPISRSAVRLLG